MSRHSTKAFSTINNIHLQQTIREKQSVGEEAIAKQLE